MSIAAKVNAESQSLVPTALINLFTLDLSPIGVNSQFYFVDMTNSQYKPLVFNGITYIPFPVQMKEYGYNGNGQLVRPKLSVSNVNGFVSNLLLQNQDLVGATVTLVRVFARFIDAVNWPGGVSPYTPDPLAAYSPEVYYINQKTREDQSIVEWELSTAFELDSIRLPSRVCLAGFCQWRYRDGLGCPYSGPPITDNMGRAFSGPPYNIGSLNSKGLWNDSMAYSPGDYVTVVGTIQALKGVPLVFVALSSNINSSPLVANTPVWVQDGCQKTQLGCKTHFPTPTGSANQVVLPFGGFPGLSRSAYVAGFSTQNT